MNILVVGGFDSSDKESQDIRLFAQALGREVARLGHTLLNGCQTEFDSVVATAAWDALDGPPASKENRVISYILAGAKPIHKYGRVIKSRLTSWDPGDGDLVAPEPIQRADVVIVVRGFDGCFRAAHWAATVRKPVLPVAYFGGAGKKLYDNAVDHFEQFGGRLEKSDFEKLNEYDDNWAKLASDVIALAEKASTSKNVLTLMSYTNQGEVATALKNAFYHFELVCKDFGDPCSRVDETNVADRILPAILEKIERAAFVIVDLTELKPNVFYELGFAEGMKKPRIITAQAGTVLPFDVKDFPSNPTGTLST